MPPMERSGFIIEPPPGCLILSWPHGVALPPQPIGISRTHFQSSMHAGFPVGIAALYAITVHLANRERSKGVAPANFTRRRRFKAFVVLHNMFLCVYSLWTCYGVGHALRKTLHDNMAIQKVAGLPAVIGYLEGSCDMEAGLWQNGLGYYGYLFYLSKVYEVIDTFIILAKGKRSSLLQTYHHAGALLAMYSGVRFMSPPIVYFILFNSFIHSIMYFYYACTTLGVSIPNGVKRLLTTLQIGQFLIGGSIAALHLFVSYYDARGDRYIRCIKNPGQSFAIMFNILYLAPLTYLFASFFIKSYMSAKTYRTEEILINKTIDKQE